MKTRIRDMLVIAAALILGMASSAPAAWAAELPVVSQPNCSYCKAWDIEVGSVYARTDEARIAPLRRVRLDALASKPYRLTPETRAVTKTVANRSAHPDG